MASKFKEIINNFGEKTSIHGIGNIVDSSNKNMIRTLWVVVILGSFTYAGYILYQAFLGTSK